MYFSVECSKQENINGNAWDGKKLIIFYVLLTVKFNSVLKQYIGRNCVCGHQNKITFMFIKPRVLGDFLMKVRI